MGHARSRREFVPQPGQSGSGSGGSSPVGINALEIQSVPVSTEAQSPVDGDILVFSAAAGAWLAEPQGGDKITSFTGIAGTVEVGTSDATLTWHATYNQSVQSGVVFWTGVATGSVNLGSGPFDTGTITGPFSSNSNGAQLAVTLQVTFVDGTVATSTQVLTWAATVVAGAQTNSPPVSPGQTLYNSLRGENSSLRTSIGGTFTIACSASQICTGAVLSSFGRLPTVKDSNGFQYTATSLGTATITENGTSQTYVFFQWGATGADGTFTFS